MSNSLVPNPFLDLGEKKISQKTHGLEWEEGAVDGNSSVEGFAEDHHRSTSFKWLFGLVSLLFVIILGQLINLQIVQGGKFRGMAEGNRLRLQAIPAPRGFIMDRNGEIIAKNQPSFNLAVVPSDLPKDTKDQIINKAALMFGFDSNEVKDKLQQNNNALLQPMVVKKGLTQQETIMFEVSSKELPGFQVISVPVRDYVDTEIFSHVLGYTSTISDTEYNNKIDQGYDINDLVGKTGIELSYEKYLRGVNGNTQVEVDASGKPIKVLGQVDPKPGNIVELNIDKGLQEVLYNSFAKRSSPKGAAIALNPKTGEVLALVSVPGFNNNLFATGISSSDYKNLLDDKNLPLFNRSISGVYPPGSTIKPVAAAAVLQDKIVDAQTTIYDGGVLKIPNQFNPTISYNFYGWKKDGLGPMTVTSAIAQSSDIYFYTVAGGHPSSPIKGIGAEKLADYYRDFGMGATTGIDIQGEKSGTVADPDWKLAYHDNDKILGKWYLGDTYHISIGQGDMLVTPLQVALWTSIIANNGTINKPTILKRVVDQQGKVVYQPKSEVLLKVNVSQENLKVVQEGMRENVISSKGSGRALDSLSVTAAGKTGTSQFDGSDPSRTHAWYTAYAPYEDPEIVVTVLVEAGGEGHAAAVPIVKEAIAWWAEKYKK